MVPVEAQFYTLLAMTLLGMVMGLFFDIYRETVNVLRLKKAVLDLWDLLIWILFIGITFVVLLYTNYGEVRFFVFIGIGIGLLAYFRLLSRTCRKIIRIGLSIFFKVLAVIWKIVRVPLTLIQKILAVPANLISLVLLKTVVPVVRKLRSLTACFKGRGKKSE